VLPAPRTRRHHMTGRRRSGSLLLSYPRCVNEVDSIRLSWQRPRPGVPDRHGRGLAGGKGPRLFPGREPGRSAHGSFPRLHVKDEV
jgi:hypothetical protein